MNSAYTEKLPTIARVFFVVPPYLVLSIWPPDHSYAFPLFYISSIAIMAPWKRVIRTGFFRGKPIIGAKTYTNTRHTTAITLTATATAPMAGLRPLDELLFPAVLFTLAMLYQRWDSVCRYVFGWAFSLEQQMAAKPINSSMKVENWSYNLSRFYNPSQ